MKITLLRALCLSGRKITEGEQSKRDCFTLRHSNIMKLKSHFLPPTELDVKYFDYECQEPRSTFGVLSMRAIAKLLNGFAVDL